MSTFVPAQNTVYTRGMTCAFWGREMPCSNGNSCKYAHHWVEHGRLADLPRRDHRTGQCFAGRNRWEFEEAKRRAAVAEQRTTQQEQRRREQEQRAMQYQYWLQQEEERQRQRQQQQQEEQREQERLRQVFASYLQRQHRVQHLQQLQREQEQRYQADISIHRTRTRTPLLSPALTDASISTLCLGAPLSPSPSPESPNSLSHLSPSSSSTIAVNPWETARQYWDDIYNNHNRAAPISYPAAGPHSPEDNYAKWLDIFMPRPREKERLFGTRHEWDCESKLKSNTKFELESESEFETKSQVKANFRTPEEDAHRDAVYRRTGMYPFPAPPKRT